MMIDLFAHIIPPELLKFYLKSGNKRAEHLQTLFRGGGYEQFFDLDHRIRFLNKFKIDIQVLNLTHVVGAFVDPKTEGELCRLGNDELVKIVEKHPDRFVAFANLPMSDPDAATQELDRAVNQLGMKGIQIFSNVNGRAIDSPEFLPVFEKAEKYDVLIQLHPTTHKFVGYDWLDNRLKDMLGWPFDTSLAMSRIVFGGIFDKFPKLKFLTHHLGAMIPYFSERIRGFSDQYLGSFIASGRPEDTPPLKIEMKKPVLDYFKMFYNDTAIYGWTPGLMCGYAFFGADKIAFGTDYPFGPDQGERWVRDAIVAIKDMQIPESEKEKIFHLNAEKLLKIS